MSYDIAVWTVGMPAYPAALPEPQEWTLETDCWSKSGQGWQVLVSAPVRVLPEDVPEAVASLLPGIEYRIDVWCEGMSGPGRKLARRTAKAIARAARGVVEEGDLVETPSGVARYNPPPKSEKLDVLALSWWFANDRLSSEPGLQALLSCLETRLPEALPRRYGTEDSAPQHQYAQTGRRHFLEFLKQNLPYDVIWRPHPPVLGVSLFVCKDWGATTLGFRCQHLEIEIDTAALRQPGWPRVLREFWHAVSELLQPFYGDVRTLKHYLRSGSGLGVGSKTQVHPVGGPWWTGIPATLGHAGVLGEPYLALWPQLVGAAARSGGLAFLSTDDWSSPLEVTQPIGGVPGGLRQPVPCTLDNQDFFAWVLRGAARGLWERVAGWFARKPAPEPERKIQYPPAWPFGSPFSEADECGKSPFA